MHVLTVWGGTLVDRPQTQVQIKAGAIFQPSFFIQSLRVCRAGKADAKTTPA